MQAQLQTMSGGNERQAYLSSRAPPFNDAAVFIENHVSLGPENQRAVFSGRVNGFVPVEEAKRRDQEVNSMWEQANDDISALFDLMSRVQAKYGRSKASPRLFDAEFRNCTWEEVMAEVQAAADAWKTRSNKDFVTMSLIDKVGQNSRALQTWIEMLPAGDYGAR